MPYFATTDNTKLYFEIQGEGKPVVFIHGWSCSHETASGIVQIMKENYRCISYSHRGHGASECPEKGFTVDQLARDLKELIDYLELKDVVLVGHSMGGYTIYSYISQFGCENISKIVVLDMSPKVINDEEWKFGAFGTYSPDDLKKDLEMVSQDVTKFMWKFWRLLLPDFAALPADMEELVAPGLLGVNHTLPLLGLWQSMFTNDYRDVVKAINIPTAYIIPEKSIYPMGAAEFIKNNAKSTVKIISFPGCTHMSLTEKPTETASEIIKFLS